MPALNEFDTYLNLLLNHPNLSPITVLSSFFLVIARLIPIMVIAPFFGAKSIPTSVRIMFSVAICAILLPQLIPSLKGDILFDFAYTGYFLKEILIGFVLAFFASIPFYVAQGSGSLTDFMRGAQSLQVTDPTTSTQTGPIGILYNYVLIATFFFIGGPFIFIDAVAKSFEIIPINSFLNPVFFSAKIPMWQSVIGLANYVLAMGIQLAAPTLIGTLMAEMFLGIANRLAPQVQIVFLGISLKSWLGLGLMAAAWYFIMTQMSKEAISWLKFINKTIIQMGT